MLACCVCVCVCVCVCMCGCGCGCWLWLAVDNPYASSLSPPPPAYVVNTAGWVVCAEAALRDPIKARVCAGNAYFIGEGVKLMRDMIEVRCLCGCCVCVFYSVSG
ncbi:MAG: hypothetical protein P4L40_13660 [Terracidiphilus sp.]|nr:hypothetical protein [Terracidiphilus sp.]